MSATPTTPFETAVKQEFDHLSRVHPTPKDIPSCWSLFTLHMECYVVRNQVKSLYRYGHMAECAQKGKDWRFCLTLKSLEPEEKRKAWLMHRANWWAERRTSGSSEDVWDIRSELIKDYPPPPIDFVLDEKTREMVPVKPT
ncbi:hypothetical protein M408DRAFT_82144 [Serendipita vermifera MAFF 305830]|uniref:Uncharacterized protein n=1 Tax=Serendipita vermifera MAFF 305830 TaxID=933852 RepID=A0A0C3AJU6_SERVB|nr:hypothetical protein M408DRAFT_82144 [Serendipita vermifera MAFF 305830]